MPGSRAIAGSELSKQACIDRLKKNRGGCHDPAIDGVVDVEGRLGVVMLDLLETLPDGYTVCHGDFYWDYLLLTSGRPVVIDRHGAGRGNPLADVAKTWLLHRPMPILPLRLAAAAAKVW